MNETTCTKKIPADGTGLSAVIFDLDGTLLNTLEDLYRAVAVTFEQYHLPPRTMDDVRRFVGNGVEKLMERAIPGGHAHPKFDAVLADFKIAYAHMGQDNTAPYDGVMDLLRRLRETGIHVAVVSNKFDAAVKSLCAHYFGDLVECAIGEKDGVRKKPAPDTVFTAMEELHVTADRCIYVGDSDVDIQTAAAAHMPCLSVTWGFRDEAFLLESGATELAHNAAEAEKALFARISG